MIRMIRMMCTQNLKRVCVNPRYIGVLTIFYAFLLQIYGGFTRTFLTISWYAFKHVIYAKYRGGQSPPHNVLRKSRIKLRKFGIKEQSNCVNQLTLFYAEFTHDTQDLRNIYATFTHDTQHLRTGVELGFWNLTVVLFTHDTLILRIYAW